MQIEKNCNINYARDRKEQNLIFLHVTALARLQAAVQIFTYYFMSQSSCQKKYYCYTVLKKTAVQFDFFV